MATNSNGAPSARGRRFSDAKELFPAVLAQAREEWVAAAGREMTKEDAERFANVRLPALEDRARKVSTSLAKALADVAKFIGQCSEELGPMAAAEVAAFFSRRDREREREAALLKELEAFKAGQGSEPKSDPPSQERRAVEDWAARKGHLPQPFAMARILNAWVIGAELTEAEYDAAIALQLSGGDQLMKLLRFATDRLPFLGGPFAGKTGEPTAVNMLRPPKAPKWSGPRAHVVILLGTDMPGRHGAPVWREFGFSARPETRLMACGSLLLGERPQIYKKARRAPDGGMVPGWDAGVSVWDAIELEENAIRAVRSRLLRR